MKKGIELTDLPAEVRNQVAEAADLIPDKYSVYAHALLLLQAITRAESVWVVNKLKRDLEYMGHRRKEKKGAKQNGQS